MAINGAVGNFRTRKAKIMKDLKSLQLLESLMKYFKKYFSLHMNFSFIK